MKLSYLAAAAILCLFGCCNDADAECTENSGQLYILRNFGQLTGDERGREWTYKILGSSEWLPKDPMLWEESNISVSNCFEALRLATMAVSKASDHISRIEERNEPNAHWYSVPNAVRAMFITKVKIAISQLLTKIPPVDWLPCEKDRPGKLYIMHLVKDKKGGPYHSCYRVVGAQEELAEYGKFKMEIPSLAYSESECQRFNVNHCLQTLAQTTASIRTNIKSPFHWYPTIVGGVKCYFVPKMYVSEFIKVVSTYIG